MNCKFVKITHFTLKLLGNYAVRTQDITHQLLHFFQQYVYVAGRKGKTHIDLR